MRSSKGRFQLGESGNPGGRPRGTSLTAKIRRALEAPDESNPSRTMGDAIVEAMIHAARNGDVQVFKLLIERVDGRVAERVEPETNDPPRRIQIPDIHERFDEKE